MAAFFSARIDETGTDGRSPYVIVAGGVSVPTEWDKLESAWNKLLPSRRVTAFHWKQFAAHDGEFAGWSSLKRKNFVQAIERIIRKTVVFQFAIAVDRAVHTAIKKEWRGVRGFKADSDYGLGFRVARFLVCDKLVRLASASSKVQFIVESGPFAADAGVIYESIKRRHFFKQPAEAADICISRSGVFARVE